MGFFSKIWKGVKNVVNKITKVVKKVVKSVGKTAKKVWDKVKDVGVKVWDGVKNVTKKVSKTMSKLGPLANIAMNFIPGFGQMWAAYGIWGQVAKGAITGFVASGGNVKGMLVGAAMGGLSYGYTKLPGTTLSEKMSSLTDRITPNAITEGAKNFSNYVKNVGSVLKGDYPSYGSIIRGNEAILQAGGGMDNLVESPWSTEHFGHIKPLEGYSDTFTPKKHAPKIQKADGPFDYLQSDAQLDSGLEGIEDTRWYETTPTGQGFAGEPGSIRGDRGPDLAQSKSSLLDKLIPSTTKPIAWGDTASTQQGYPYTADVSPLTSYNISAGGARGQVGTGTDVYDVNKLGLLAAVDRIRRSEQEFLVS
jgi:hypothetical protein